MKIHENPNETHRKSRFCWVLWGIVHWEKGGFIGDFIHEEIGISWDFMEIFMEILLGIPWHWEKND